MVYGLSTVDYGLSTIDYIIANSLCINANSFTFVPNFNLLTTIVK